MTIRPAHAASIAILAYLPESGEFASPTVVGADVIGNNLTRGSGLSEATGTTFNSKEWQESSLNNAIASDDCLHWGFSSSTAYDLSSLSIRYDRSETGPTEIAIQINVGSGFSTIFTDTDINTDGEENSGIDLSTFQSATTANFRLCGFGASSSAGTFDLEATSSFDGNNGIVIFAEEATTPIMLATFDAYAKNGSIVIEWTTAAEIDNAGYYIYGGPTVDGPWTKLNSSLIAATGTPTESAIYSAMFTSKAPFYMLEDVNFNGETTRHSPVQLNVALTDARDDTSNSNYDGSSFAPRIYLPLFR